MYTLAEMIRILRMRKGLTQKGLAEMVGLKYQSIQKWEKGSGKPTTTQLSAVAAALDVSIQELIEGKIPNEDDGPGMFTEGNIASVRKHMSEYLVPVKLLSAKAQASMPSMSYDTFNLNWVDETYPVFLPKVAITERHLVIEVVGSSMEPEIKDGALLLGELVSRNDIRYESGAVYAVLYGGNHFVVKNIRTNDLNTNRTLRLWSEDQKYGNIDVHGEDIIAMWKILGQVWVPMARRRLI
ncbi:hypothetical protein GCM10028805_47130 [Spirosoma harenae]